MNRREFITRSTFFSVGGLLIPSSLWSSGVREILLDDANFDGNVIVIGAGAAGLYAGYVLKAKGIDFKILEASTTVGGRLGKCPGFADYTVDTGAQWLHGKNNILFDLLKTKNVKTTLDDLELSYWFNQRLVKSLPKNPFIFEEDNLPDVSFKEYARQQGFGKEYDHIVEAIAGDQGASAALLSAYWNYKEEEQWDSGDEDFKFQKTYFEVFEEHIAQPIQDKVVLNTPVHSIDYSSDKVVVTDVNGVAHSADKVIITVPISILKLNEVSFRPELPSEKTEAFSKIGMGPGMKVFLKFTTKFYVDALYGGAICGGYFDDTVGKQTADHVLLAFVMGDQAAYLHSLGSDEAITNALLQELDDMYGGQASRSFIASRVFDFTAKPFIKGAYSYSTVNMGNARAIAALPVAQKLYFAGEAMNTNGHHQTVHGAVETGYHAVIQILKDAKK